MPTYPILQESQSDDLPRDPGAEFQEAIEPEPEPLPKWKFHDAPPAPAKPVSATRDISRLAYLHAGGYSDTMFLFIKSAKPPSDIHSKECRLRCLVEILTEVKRILPLLEAMVEAGDA